MTDCPTTTITLSLPTATVERLKRFAFTYSGGHSERMDNAASMAINTGIDVFVEKHPDYLERYK